jgi:hypothetical protein
MVDEELGTLAPEEPNMKTRIAVKLHSRYILKSM